MNVSNVDNQGFVTKQGKKILLINKVNTMIKVQLPAEAKDAVVDYVDVTTMENPPAKQQLTANSISLKPFAVAVITFKN